MYLKIACTRDSESEVGGFLKESEFGIGNFLTHFCNTCKINTLKKVQKANIAMSITTITSTTLALLPK